MATKTIYSIPDSPTLRQHRGLYLGVWARVKRLCRQMLRFIRSFLKRIGEFRGEQRGESLGDPPPGDPPLDLGMSWMTGGLCTLRSSDLSSVRSSSELSGSLMVWSTL